MSQSPEPVQFNPTDGEQTLRSHPPRLQHSPSMPNLWFPPHSGPIPPRFTKASDRVLERPPTPPSCIDLKDTHTAIISGDAYGAAEDPKIHRRRRINYDQPNALLTPPLTPSSSIRTAGSIGSSASYNTSLDSATSSLQCSNNEGNISFTDSDTESTRFLLVENLSKNVTTEMLQSAILRSLSNLTLPHSTTSVVSSGSTTNTSLVPSSNRRSPASEAIKGVLLRYHSSHGIAILAFYDVRQAKAARLILSAPTTGTLADCVEAGGQNGWLKCAFVTAQDLAEKAGKSPFLAETQGFFHLEASAIPLDAGGTQKSQRDVDIATLVNVLKGHGAVRSFLLAQEGRQTALCMIFYVEYYDVREANAAAEALHDKVLFGMHLSVLKPDLQALDPKATISDTANSESCIPFPDFRTDKAFPPPAARIDGPGQQSQIRERFLFVETAGKVRPRSVSADQKTLETSLTLSVPPNSTDSPPYFYTSPSSSPSDILTPRTPDSHSRRVSNHLFFDAVGRVCGGTTRPRSVSFDSVAGQQSEITVTPRQVVRDHDASALVEYNRPPFHPPQPLYSPTPPLPSAFSYGYSAHPAQLAASGFPPNAPSPLGYPYDFEHAHSAMNMGNWVFEQAMMVPANTYPGLPYSPINTSPVHDYWQGCPTPSPQQAAFFQYPPNPQACLPPQKFHSSPAFGHSSTLPSPAIPSRAAVHGPPSAASAAERNQLNLSRIEDGQDTRTTVMIKNIPNKMSDKDLMAYIGNVCPRKIDFLYLRMDFKNGCNVGYAFVNFISVQDLLHFAKAKLGEKWNMFSSEKVLQMSYANYQGKEALVEKFKNSCIMDEIPAWRPKIFYSEPGPEQGLPQPFPAPTHLKRKERSSYNRGPLYVPGTMTGFHSSQTRRQQADDRHRERLIPNRHSERPRRFWDADEQRTPLTLADEIAAISLGGKPAQK